MGDLKFQERGRFRTWELRNLKRSRYRLLEVEIPSNGIKNILLLLWVEGVVGQGSRGCESRGCGSRVRVRGGYEDNQVNQHVPTCVRGRHNKGPIRGE